MSTLKQRIEIAIRPRLLGALTLTSRKLAGAFTVYAYLEPVLVSEGIDALHLPMVGSLFAEGGDGGERRILRFAKAGGGRNRILKRSGSQPPRTAMTGRRASGRVLRRALPVRRFQRRWRPLVPMKIRAWPLW